jgi:uncharacterized protein (TIGR04222 family)
MANQLRLSQLQSSEPWGLSGPQFLGLYLAGLALCAALAFCAFMLARRTREAGDPSSDRDLDVYEGAYLAGGPRRVAQTAAFSLLAADRIRGSRSGTMTTVVADGATASKQDDVAQVVYDALAQQEPTHMDPVLSVAAKDPTVVSIGERLRREGLVRDKDQTHIHRSVLLPIAALLLVGLARLIEGLSNGRPVLFLLVLLAATVGLGMVLAASQPLLRTPRGNAKLDELRATTFPIGGLALASVTAIDVALLGADAIRDTEISGWLFGAASGGSGGGGYDGGGGGDGGGGCGGGGCGG